MSRNHVFEISTLLFTNVIITALHGMQHNKLVVSANLGHLEEMMTSVHISNILRGQFNRDGPHRVFCQS